MDIDAFIESYKDEMIESIQEFIKIPSVKGRPLKGKPFGAEIDKALEYALNTAAKLGFKTVNVDNYGGYAEFGSGEKTLAILAHLDVVPAGEGWTYPPFAGEIHDNKIYGRGTIDDKGPLISALYAMKAVKEFVDTKNIKVRILFGTDEESGWEGIKYVLSKIEKPDMAITPDANYPVIFAEKGIMDIEIIKNFDEEQIVTSGVNRVLGGYRANMVPEGCVCEFSKDKDADKILKHIKDFKEYSDSDIKADLLDDKKIIVNTSGISAHGSTPEKGKNAISSMLAFLSTLGLGPSDMEKFIITINNKIGSELQGESLNLSLADDISGDLTVNLGIVQVDRKTGRAVLNIRYPVSYSRETVIERIKTSFKEDGVSVRVSNYQPPLHVPKDSYLVKTLCNVYEDVVGERLTPLAIGGGTYARSIDNAVAFGIVFPGEKELAHQKNEYIDIDSLMLSTRLYAHAISRLVEKCE